jgi:glycerol-3-phosphate acyltransferase PlsY
MILIATPWSRNKVSMRGSLRAARPRPAAGFRKSAIELSVISSPRDAGARCYNAGVIAGKTEQSMLELGVKFLISYFIGSLMGAIIVGRLRGGVDIRTMGSGNAGGTNALRTQGAVFALGVIIIDIGKGAIATGVVPGLEIPFVPADPAVSRTWLTLCCGTAAVFGHVWPIYHRFQGGKGAATFIGTLIFINAPLIIPLVLVWAWVLVLSGYVGLATMVAAVALPIWVGVSRFPAAQPLLIYCAVIAGFIVYWHRSNIDRMRAGTEHRNTGLMLFGRKRRAGNDDPF